MARAWVKVLGIGLTLWVLRGPVVAVATGAAILWFVPQAQDLLVEPVMDGCWPALLLATGVLFAWAIPTHYAARLLVATDARYVSTCCFRGCLARWSPRLLAMLIFVILIGAAFRARGNIPDLNGADIAISDKAKNGLLWLAAGFAVLMVVFLAYAMKREALANWPPVRAFESFAQATWKKVPNWLRMPFSLNPAQAVSASALGPLLLLVLFGALAVWPIFRPYDFAAAFPRAAAVPFVLGGWIPLLALLSGLGRRYRVPFITLIIVLLLVLPVLLGSSYRVEPVNASHQARVVRGDKADPVDTQRLTLKKAIELWKERNPCDNDGCPRPIIVAASGGASRAGFFTASVIGQMLDGNLPVSGQQTAPISGEALRNRLFAFSTVSGSSVGAVMAIAAMAAASDQKQPCTGKTPLWYRAADGRIDTWRDCLEALMAGDFLTPIFTGFVFHDVLRFIG